MGAPLESDQPAPREGYISVGKADLFYRETGLGQPVVLLHGGPDFDHRYLLPDMDRLVDGYRLIYYDQRGRGNSARNVRPEDVSMDSEIEDLERLRGYFQLDSLALLGHSWGGILGMAYALRYPERLSHLILMNSAPASYDDFMMFRQERRGNSPGDIEQLQALAATAGYQEGDPDTVAAYYRIHFRATLRGAEHLERVIESLRSSFTREGILKARAVEARLAGETLLSSDYNLLPRLRQLTVRTLVIHGEDDFIPVDCAAHIAEAIPGARFVLLRDCGHFSYLECPNEVRDAIDDFFHRS